MTFKVHEKKHVSAPGQTSWRELPNGASPGMFRRLTWLACIAVIFFWMCIGPCSTPVHAAPPSTETDIEFVPASDEVRIYGNRVPEPRVLAPEGMPQEEITRRPFLYWRAWANQRLPFGRVFLALLLASAIISFAVQRKILKAAALYRKKWLRCFGVGILFFVIGLAAAGVMTRMGLFAPVATALVIAVQLAALIGLTVAAQSIGQRVLGTLHLESKISKPWLITLITIGLGTLILSLLALVPGFGAIPPMGTRMLALIAATGAGSFLITLWAE